MVINYFVVLLLTYELIRGRRICCDSLPNCQCRALVCVFSYNKAVTFEEHDAHGVLVAESARP